MWSRISKYLCENVNAVREREKERKREREKERKREREKERKRERE